MATVESKTCSACKQTLPCDAFSPDRRATTGLQPACKRCCRDRRNKTRCENIDAERAKERARYRSNPRIRERNNEWRKANRDKVLAGKKRWYERIKNTPKYRAYIKARQEAKREAKREYDRARRMANPEYWARKAAEWNKRNPDKRRAIMANYTAKRRAKIVSGVSAAKLRAWVNRRKKVCHWCRRSCRDNYHIDHYVPLAKGGPHALSNLVISCDSCNIRKNAKDPLVFAREMGMRP